MQRRILGKTGYIVSPVMFGGIINRDETPENAANYVAYAVDKGVNYFDVAPTYGNSEEKLGPALEPYRNHVYLACKTNKRDRDSAREELLNSLKLLKTDYFDVYQLHAMTTQEDLDKAFGPNGVMETLVWAKHEGLVREIGFSTHNEDVALKAIELFNFATVLFPMNWAMAMNTGWGDRIAAKVKEKNMGLLAMKAMIERGWLETDDRSRFPKSWCKPIYEAQLTIAAIKYALHKGAHTLVPPGNFEHFTFLVENIDECIKNPITGEELEMLRKEAGRDEARGNMIFKV